MTKRLERVRRAVADRQRRERAQLLGDEIEDREDKGVVEMQMQQVMQGVTLTWLHYVFKRDRITAKTLLADCPVIRMGKGGAPIYDVADAAAYLVKPKLDVIKLLGTLKEGDLPDDLRPKIWQARLSRQRWEREAGVLWRGSDVMEVFGKTFKAMREAMQLWADEMAEETALSEAQRVFIVSRVDALQATLHKTLIELASRGKTPSIASTIDTEGKDVTELRDTGGDDRRDRREHPSL